MTICRFDFILGQTVQSYRLQQSNATKLQTYRVWRSVKVMWSTLLPQQTNKQYPAKTIFNDSHYFLVWSSGDGLGTNYLVYKQCWRYSVVRAKPCLHKAKNRITNFHNRQNSVKSFYLTSKLARSLYYFGIGIEEISREVP